MKILISSFIKIIINLFYNSTEGNLRFTSEWFLKIVMINITISHILSTKENALDLL